MFQELNRTLRLTATATLGAALLLTPAAIGVTLNDDDARPATDEAGSNLPEAKELFKAMLNAMGGKEAFDKIKSTYVVAEMNTPMGDMKMESRFANPDKFLMEQDVPGMGRQRMGSDGKVGWMHNPMMGYDLIDSEQLEGMTRQANMHMMLLQFDDEFEEMTTIERAEFKGKDCYKVKLVPKEGNGTQHGYFNRESGLLEAMEIEQRGPQGRGMTMTMEFDEWKEVDDVKLFHKLHIDQMGMRMTMTFTKIELNAVDNEVFELPEQVRALARERDAQEEDRESGE